MPRTRLPRRVLLAVICGVGEHPPGAPLRIPCAELCQTALSGCSHHLRASPAGLFDHVTGQPASCGDADGAGASSDAVSDADCGDAHPGLAGFAADASASASLCWCYHGRSRHRSLCWTSRSFLCCRRTPPEGQRALEVAKSVARVFSSCHCPCPFRLASQS